MYHRGGLLRYLNPKRTLEVEREVHRGRRQRRGNQQGAAARNEWYAKPASRISIPRSKGADWPLRHLQKDGPFHVLYYRLWTRRGGAQKSRRRGAVSTAPKTTTYVMETAPLHYESSVQGLPAPVRMKHP
jgi:hypothetical protein